MIFSLILSSLKQIVLSYLFFYLILSRIYTIRSHSTMTTSKFYYDDPDGDLLSKETSHPNFVKLLTSEFYYDCTDEFSPFGNDDGADVLINLEDWYRENGPLKKPLKFLKPYVEHHLGLKSKYIELTDIKKILKINAGSEFIFNSIDSAIIATGFAQYKIEGQIQPDLKALVLLALERQKMLIHNRLKSQETELKNLLQEVEVDYNMQGDSGSFQQYIDRIDKMKGDLAKLI